jgi:hypothetical protein
MKKKKRRRPFIAERRSVLFGAFFFFWAGREMPLQVRPTEGSCRCGSLAKWSPADVVTERLLLQSAVEW